MSLKDNTRAYVLAVLTGDTLLVRYFEQVNKYAVILLPVACAPQFSIFLNSAVNDPFAVESLEFLREHVESKKVLIGPPLQYDGPKEFTHQTLGPLPVSTNTVRLSDDPNEDLDAYLIQSGFARIKPNIPKKDKTLISRYKQLQEAAQINKLGVWGTHSPPIDPSLSSEFSSVLISLNNDFTFKLLEPQIDVEIAGVTKQQEIPISEFNTFLGEKILFHKVSVRILQRPISPTAPPIVSITINNFDLSPILVEKHFAQINEVTAHFLSNDTELRRISKVNDKCGHEFSAKVTNILSSRSFLADDKTIILSHIHVPHFDFSKESEKHGIEAFRFLRDKVLNQTVKVDVVVDNDGEIYGIVKVGIQNINLLMVKEGHASIVYSRIQGIPSFFDEMKRCFEAAKNNKIGIHSNEPLSNNQQTKQVGIVYDIVSPTKVAIFIEGSIRICTLQNLKANDYSYSIVHQAIDILKAQYLQRDVELTVDGSIVEITRNEDIRIPLLSNGYAISINKFTTNRPSLAAAENIASSSNVAKMGDFHTKISDLAFKDPVIVTNVLNTTTYLVQSQSDTLTQIQTNLINYLSAQPTKAAHPKPNKFYVVSINGKVYRGQVLSSGKIYLLIDYGIVMPITVGEFYTCPPPIAKFPSQAVCVSLAKCTNFGDKDFDERATKFIWNFFDKKDLYDVKVISQESLIPQVMLLDNTSKNNVQTLFIQEGLIKLDPLLGNQANEFSKIEADAMKKKVGGWSIDTK